MLPACPPPSLLQPGSVRAASRRTPASVKAATCREVPVPGPGAADGEGGGASAPAARVSLWWPVRGLELIDFICEMS